jgi:hypothetical protein
LLLGSTWPLSARRQEKGRKRRQGEKMRKGKAMWRAGGVYIDCCLLLSFKWKLF